ncbi:MAG: hypothetical protein RLZZ352_2567 [Pseudomonadota bacterium]|jgi:hypothetical protein
MLTPEFVQELLSDLESDRVERTVSTHNTDKFAQGVAQARIFDAQPSGFKVRKNINEINNLAHIKCYFM